MKKPNFDFEKVKNYFYKKYGINIKKEDLFEKEENDSFEEIPLFNYTEKEEIKEEIQNIEDDKNYKIGEVIEIELPNNDSITVYIIDGEIYGHNENIKEYEGIPEYLIEEFIELDLKKYSIPYAPIETIENPFYNTLFKKYGKIKNMFKAKIYLDEESI